MKIILSFIIVIMLGCASEKSGKDAILKVMQQQEQDWNNGNLKEFMQGYWQSDSLMFVGKNGIKYGWQTTLANYEKSYPDKNTMGKLEFDVLKLETNNNTAYMLGKWKLIRNTDTPNGYFTLYWKKIDGKWVITIDHTS